MTSDSHLAPGTLSRESLDWEALQRDAAAKQSVVADIHPRDMLWQFIKGLAIFQDPTTAADYYFADGAESGRKIARLIEEHVPHAAAYSLLEFASGYGMVSRHLGRTLPNATVTSCDIHDEAIGFLRESLGMNAVLSTHVPEELDLGRQFDVVFALSFFSHLPKDSFGRWIAALYATVKPDGLLAFTANGFSSAPNFGSPELENGFWFTSVSEQHDLDGAEYGSTLSAPAFVLHEIFSRTDGRLKEFKASYWWKHQDLYVIAKPPL